MMFLKRYIRFLDKSYKDKNILIKQIDNLEIKIKDIPVYYKDYKDLLVRYLKICGNSLGDLPKHLRDDKELALAAISSVGSSFVFASDRLKADKEIILNALNVPFGSALRIIEEMNSKYYDDEDVMSLAVKKNNSCFKYCSEKLKNNFDFIFNLLKDYPNLYMDCVDKIKSNEKIIEIIIEQEPKLLLESIPLQSLNKDFIYNILEEIYVKNGDVIFRGDSRGQSFCKLKYYDVLLGFEDKEEVSVSMIINKRDEDIIVKSITTSKKTARINKF